MEMTTTLPVDPQDIGKVIFDAGLYDGELKSIGILIQDADTQYSSAGDMTLRFNVHFDTGAEWEDRFPMQGTQAWKAQAFLKGLGAKKGEDLSIYEGSKLRVEFKEPRKSDSGRTFNSFSRISRI
jgi:hypothetical protein